MSPFCCSMDWHRRVFSLVGSPSSHSNHLSWVSGHCSRLLHYHIMRYQEILWCVLLNVSTWLRFCWGQGFGVDFLLPYSVSLGLVKFLPFFLGKGNNSTCQGSVFLGCRGSDSSSSLSNLLCLCCLWCGVLRQVGIIFRIVVLRSGIVSSHPELPSM